MQARRRTFALPSLTAVAVLGVVVVVAAGCGSSSGSKTIRATTSTTRSSIPLPSSTAAAASPWTSAQSTHQAPLGWLDGVDCVTATNCVAVGNELTATGPPGQALVETLHGRVWSSAIAPPAPGSHGDYLFSVSCPRAGSCVAVGYSFAPTASGGGGVMLIETLAGGAWSVTPPPPLGPGYTESFLNGVSCATPTSCVAVGSTDGANSSVNQPLILTSVNGSWSVMASPSLPPVHGLLSNGVLNAVSCPGPTTCIATGYRATSATTQTFVESLAGGTWSVEPSPGSGTPTAENGAWGLSGLSCPSASSCVAVGQLQGPGPLVDVMAGGMWSMAPTPAPDAGARASGLYGVSCTTTATCVAVGDLARSYSSDAGDGALGAPLRPFIASDSGGTWTVTPGPTGLPAHSGLHAVSCVGQTCVAVGQSGQFTSATSTSKTLIIERG